MHHYKWSAVELCITRSGFYVADTVPDLRAIESRAEATASQINRRAKERGGKEREKRKAKRRDERKRGTEEDDAMPAGDERMRFIQPRARGEREEGEGRARGGRDEAGGCVSELFSDRPRYRRRIFLDDALSCFG